MEFEIKIGIKTKIIDIELLEKLKIKDFKNLEKRISLAYTGDYSSNKNVVCTHKSNVVTFNITNMHNKKIWRFLRFVNSITSYDLDLEIDLKDKDENKFFVDNNFLMLKITEEEIIDKWSKNLKERKIKITEDKEFWLTKNKEDLITAEKCRNILCDKCNKDAHHCEYIIRKKIENNDEKIEYVKNLDVINNNIKEAIIKITDLEKSIQEIKNQIKELDEILNL